MLVPYKPVYFKKATRRFRYIVIHDLSCRFADLDKAKVDTIQPVASHLRSYNWIFNDEFDLPYHFLCERIGMDYETLLGTPFCYYCIFDDIPSEFIPSIHIGVAGNFNVTQPDQRAYRQIGYRAVASAARWFKIPFGHIYLHRDISKDKESSCPGPLFDKGRFMAAIKPMVLMKG